MSTKRKPPDWNPIRRGRVYCSPACGAGCTYSAFAEATVKAKSIAENLGPGWSPEVWENMGWHWSVNRLRKRSDSRLDAIVSIRPSGKGYCAQIHGGSMPGPSVDHPSTSIQMWGRGATPRAALLVALTSARVIAQGMAAAMREAATVAPVRS